MIERKDRIELTYEASKQAKTGTIITCPMCRKQFKKKQYSQAFCCIACKDAYWDRKGDRHRPGYYKERNKRK